MKQTRLASFLESCWQVGIGFLLAYLTYKFVIVPCIDKGIFSYTDALIINSIMAVVSLTRSFAIRRIAILTGGLARILRSPSRVSQHSLDHNENHCSR